MLIGQFETDEQVLLREAKNFFFHFYAVVLQQLLMATCNP